MVNRKLKKCASLFLVMSMAVSMLAGCGSKNATEEASSTSDVVLPDNVTTVFNDNIASVALGQMKPEDMAALVDEELEK